MAEKKRYFWFRMYSDFFQSRRVKKLRKLSDTHLIVYLKMQLKAICHDGLLVYEDIDSSFYDEVAIDIEEDEDVVSQTIDFLLSHGLAEPVSSSSIYLPYAVKNVGSEGASALRKRASRAKHSGTCDNVTEFCDNVTDDDGKRHGEIEIYKEIDTIDRDIDTSIEIDKSSIINNSADAEKKDDGLLTHPLNYEWLIRMRLKAGDRDGANRYYLMAKESGVDVDISKIQNEFKED